MHRIQRLDIELKIRDRDRAQARMERVSALYHGQLSRIAERLFDSYSSAHKYHRVPRLEIDLGVIQAEVFEVEFVRRFERELRAALGRSLWQWEVRSPDAQEVQDGLSLLETFALTGNVPSWAAVAEPDLVERHLQRVAEAAPRALLELLVQLQAAKAALPRLARHASEPFVAALCAHIAPHAPVSSSQIPPGGVPGAALERRILALRRIVAGYLGHRGGAQPVGPAAAGQAPDSVRDPQATTMASAAEAEAEPATKAEAEPATAADPSTPDRAPAPTSLASVRLGGEGPMAPAAGSDTGRGPVALGSKPSPLATTLATTPRNPPDPHHAQSERSAPRPRRDARIPPTVPRRSTQLDEVFTAQAGLVLLWPFLERFFARLGLLSEARGFVDAAAQSRGVALLGYLVTQQPDPPEYQSALAKVLCGLSPLSELLPAPEPTPEIQAECERLLQAVVDHAVAGDEPQLSVGDLRSRFLAREGLLAAGRGGLRLHVLRDEALDQAMSRFRWTWAFVKLPFMSQPLQVEW